MTTQGEVEISGPDPSVAPSSNSASSIESVITWHSLALSFNLGQRRRNMPSAKKNPPG
jgi:hypothetical protein